MISLGCAKNQADSETVLGQIVVAERRAVLCSEPEDADIVVVNTCGFLKAARDEADETLSAVEELQVSGHVKRIVVIGCYPQLWKGQVMKRHPGLYAVMGADAMYQTRFWEELLRDPVVSPIQESVDVATIRTFEAPRVLVGSRPYAYLKISDGCSEHCTYCTIPQIKGPLVSRTPETILHEAEQLVQAGASEIILVAQNTSAYGMDLSPNRHPRLASLLRALDELQGITLLRVLYLYPTLVTDELLETMAGSRHIVHYVDIPLQHTDPTILKSMSRPWTEKSTTRIIERVREAMPDAAIRSTFIVGFPGETEDQFQRLLHDVSALRLDHASAFAYSREAKAVSATFPNQIHEATKNRRLREFMAVQQEISLSINQQRYLNKDIQIIVDETTQSGFSGRTMLDAPDVDNVVVVSSVRKRKPAVGSICTVHITAAGPYDLEGILV
ncbi:MAG: 30S ribosomal protein S12 methylthiotransferase RimO [Candidatus Cryosericum sp.]